MCLLFSETKGFVDFLFTKLESGLKDEYTYFIKVKEEPVERGEVSVAGMLHLITLVNKYIS